MRPDPTKKQKQIYDFILGHIQGEGLSPTLREIGRHFNVSVGTIQDQLAALAAKGWLKQRPGGLARGILPASKTGSGIPILGRVGAGNGLIAQEDISGHLSFQNFTLGADYLLRVKGDSMVNAGILEGDLVQVRRQPNAEDRDIVVALVGEEGVVKRLKKRGRAWQLESSNPKYAPITVDFQIIGKVVGLVRRYGAPGH